VNRLPALVSHEIIAKTTDEMQRTLRLCGLCRFAADVSRGIKSGGLELLFQHCQIGWFKGILPVSVIPDLIMEVRPCSSPGRTHISQNVR